jgi:signal transduction histidine kinase
MHNMSRDMMASGHEGNAGSRDQYNSGIQPEEEQLTLLGIGADAPPRLSILLAAILGTVHRIQVEYSRVLKPNPGLSQEIEAIGSATREATQIAQELHGLALRQAVAQMGEMAVVLAHEVRNPLAGIVHGVQYLCDELSLEGEEAQSARFILEECRRISRLLKEILLTSRPQEVELVPCDLPAILEGLLHYWRVQAAARGVEVCTLYSEGLEHPAGDPARLEQVFANLISNALDAMLEGGTLWIRGRSAQLPPSILHQSPRAGVRVEVEDTGVGIPAQQLQRIFEPFFTTRQDRTGLGLAIARRIVQDHRGMIEVQSEEMKGTIFTVTLPLTEGGSGSAGGQGRNLPRPD